jgi:hypothetical protein
MPLEDLAGRGLNSASRISAVTNTRWSGIVVHTPDWGRRMRNCAANGCPPPDASHARLLPWKSIAIRPGTLRPKICSPRFTFPWRDSEEESWPNEKRGGRSWRMPGIFRE